MVAMHMANELLTPMSAGILILVAAGFLAYASWRTHRSFDPGKVPLMGVMGAFVFAAQMINFPILPGTSGHLGGGVLLAILLGPHAATLVMASILIVQCLIFQDGGLLALGANIINLGVVPCYLGYGLFHAIAGPQPKKKRLYAAVFVATLVGMVAGAALVPFEVYAAGVVAVPLTYFLVVMVGIHLLVGLGEALITFMVIGYLVNVRPETLGPAAAQLRPAGEGLSPRLALGSILVVAFLLGGVASLFASGFPDALESITSVEEAGDRSLVAENRDETMARTSSWQEETAPMPDYQVRGTSEGLGTTISGLVGTAITLVLVWLIGRGLRRRAESTTTVADGPAVADAAERDRE